MLGLFGKSEHLCVFTAPSLWMNLCEVNMSDDGGLFSGAADRGAFFPRLLY